MDNMRIHRLVFVLLAWTGTFTFVEPGHAQSPAPSRTAATVQTKDGAAALAPRVSANLAQLMRGILFPASNVIFAAQGDNPNDVPPAKDPATATKMASGREQRLGSS